MLLRGLRIGILLDAFPFWYDMFELSRMVGKKILEEERNYVLLQAGIKVRFVVAAFSFGVVSWFSDDVADLEFSVIVMVSLGERIRKGVLIGI